MRTIAMSAVMAIGLSAAVHAEPAPMPVWKVKAEAQVTASLRDPRSASFLAVEKVGRVVCGYVNAKNGHGGYNGHMGFVVIPPAEQTTDSIFDDAQAETVMFADDGLSKAAMATLCKLGV